jgi:hypothetical protein
MKDKRRLLYCALVALVLLAGIGIYNHCTRKPVVVGVERDTVVVYDTIPHYYPVPKDSAVVKYVTRYLRRTDTVEQFIAVNNMTDQFADVSNMIDENSVSSVSNSVTDSVAVVVPITSKHYSCKDYDAWVSGYEPSLDSIKVYQRTEYITERVTISKPPNKWELDAMTGIDYNVTSQHYSPYAGGELLYKPNRLQVGIRGGVVKGDNKAEPFAGAVVKIRLF